MSDFANLRGIANDISNVLRQLDDARATANRMREERDEQARKARLGTELWRAASALLRPTNMTEFMTELSAFQKVVERTGDTGLDPDAIPF